MTLRTRFTLISVCTAILVAVAVFAVSKQTLNEAESRYSNATLRGKEVLWGRITGNPLDRLGMASQTFADARDTRLALARGDIATLAELTLQTLEQLKGLHVTAAQVSNSEGNLLYHSATPAQGDSPSPLVRKAMSTGQLQAGIERDDRGQLAAAVALPVISSSDALLGVVRLEIDLNVALQDFKRNDSSEVFILNPGGEVEFGTDVSLYKGLSLGRLDAGARRLESRELGAHIYTVAVQPLLDFSGVPVAHLVSANDTTASYTAHRNIQSTAYLVILLGMAVVVFSLFAYMRHAFAPLNNLIDSVQRVGKGEIEVRAEVTSKDEIGELGTAFNKMAQRIQDSIEHERQMAEDVQGKVELISEVVELAAQGDLTGQLMVYRDKDVISELADGIQGMLDNLSNLVSQVQQSGIQVTSSATEIAATAKQQEATVSEQAATTNEIRATVTEISATSKELVKTMDQVTDVAWKTSEEANQGRTSLKRMEDTMHQMMDATTSIGSKLAVLSEKAGNINTVVTTITKVADQTNLLSLNAAIEAEKAGEYGVGFAVVATEIRRLADQTAVATWDIEQMVKEMQSAVSAGVMGMEKFSTEVKRGVEDVAQVGAQLGKIIEQVENLIPRFEEVHEGMQSQSQGAGQISETMIQLSETAQQTAESLRQSNGAIQQLNEAARRLQEGASHFKVNALG